jgi:hypothetical protein
MATLTVSLAQREYQIAGLGFGPTLEWRKQLIPLADRLFELVEKVPGLADTEINDIGQLIDIAKTALPFIIQDAPLQMFELLIAYGGKQLADDRDKIFNQADESEVITAFLAVLKVAFPLEAWRKVFSAIGSIQSAAK